MSNEQIDDALQRFADGFAQSYRAPVVHTPVEEGLTFEEVTFPATDGLPLEGWFMPAAESDKLIIPNHPRRFSRSGQPSNLEPWKVRMGAGRQRFRTELRP